MTQHDRLQQEVARLTQRQDQLERQQRQTSSKVDAIKRDADTMTRDVDRRIESLRSDVNWQFEWRVKSLESSRDSTFNIMMYTLMIGAVVALFITLAISIIDAREERQEMTPPEERPLSSACPRCTDEKLSGLLSQPPANPERRGLSRVNGPFGPVSRETLRVRGDLSQLERGVRF